MPECHVAWRQADPRDAAALGTIAAQLAPNAERLPPVLVRILFAQEAVEAEPFALYDIAAEIEDVRARAFGGTDRPVVGWELASAAVEAAAADTAPVLRRLYDAYDALDPNAEGSLTPAARVAEQVFRLAAPLCADGCRSCVHQAQSLQGLYRALAGQWGDGAALAEFQRKGLLEGLEAWRGNGCPSFAIAADTGSGKTEAAVLPLIAGALGDAIEGIVGVRAILA
jgi:hypothetical protein